MHASCREFSSYPRDYPFVMAGTRRGVWMSTAIDFWISRRIAVCTPVMLTGGGAGDQERRDDFLHISSDYCTSA